MKTTVKRVLLTMICCSYTFVYTPLPALDIGGDTAEGDKENILREPRKRRFGCPAVVNPLCTSWQH